MTPAELLEAHGLDDAARRLQTYASAQRWFGGRGRAVVSAEIADAGSLRETEPPVLHCVLDVGFADGNRERYNVPLAVLRGGIDAISDPNRVVGEGRRDGEPVAVVDALAVPDCAAVLWRIMAGHEEIATLRGVVRGDGEQPPLQPDDVAAIHPLGRDSSNTALLRGEEEFLKCVRRLEDGPSPELEMTRVLSAAGFTQVAIPLGSIEYVRNGGPPALLAVLQPYLRNATEGWALALTSLRDLYADAEAETDADPDRVRTAVEEQGSTFLPEAARLGELTAAMHLALSRDDLGSAVAPQAVSPELLGGWADAMTAELDDLLQSDATAVEPLRAGRSAVVAAFDAIRGIASAGLAVRHHGDYHLGQVLRTDSGWIVLDFEGEPDRPAEQRRQRSSSLRDVAGMLRSFDYAAAAALAERCDPDDADWARLRAYGDAWSAANRRLFWGAYLARCGDSALLPPSSVDTLALRRAFELQKAVYEVGYELGHRPDWAAIPVRFILAEVTS